MRRVRGRLLEVGLSMATVLTAATTAVAGEQGDSSLQVLQRMDLNHDGKLTPNEIPRGAESFVAGIVREGGLDSSKPVSLERLAAARRSLPQRESDATLKSKVLSQGSSGSSEAPADSAAKYAENLLRLYDKNLNGTLESEEWKQLNPSWGKWDTNGDGTLKVTELAAAFAAIRREGAKATLRRPAEHLSSAASVKISYRAELEQRSYRFLTPTERLPPEMPTWFLTNDADGDGQVAMAEFACEWTDAKVAEFTKYDLNSDGIITSKECLAAEKQLPSQP